VRRPNGPTLRSTSAVGGRRRWTRGGLIDPEKGRSWTGRRRTARICTRLSIKGAPAKAIQELGGHQSLGTTLRYMHLSPSARESAIQLPDGT
jgi:integrase